MATKQQAEAETTAAATEKVVKYIGTADERSISAADWKSIEVEDQKQVVWNRRNKFTVPASELTEAALRYLDEDDSGFVVTDKV